MNYSQFKQQYQSSDRELAKEVFLRHQSEMQVKKEKTAVNNLEKIFKAVFSIAYKKGFQAMTMRDLSRSTGMSLGSLYAYFPSKDKLLSIIQKQGWAILKGKLEQVKDRYSDPAEKLFGVIKAHIYLSELFRPWFYFTFMEARNIKPADFEEVKAMEAYTQTILTDLLEEGEKAGIFNAGNHDLTASMIKSMQQEWYLKRWKYRQLKVPVDQFADHLIAMVSDFCMKSAAR